MSFNTLRAIANRLTATPTELLPQQIGFLANSISSCKVVLSNSSPSNDESVTIHKLRTKVSALLQDRTPEGRLSGIIIAKALIEHGGQAILGGSANWVRALISCLSKPDSVESKRLCIVTITRLYLSTVDNQTLVREITTPTLPAFITTSLSIIKPSTSTADGKIRRLLSPLLDVVLRSWYRLLQAFPGTCRPHTTSIKTICLSIISDFQCSEDISQAAINTLAIIHQCAPKGNGPKDWSLLCQQAIEAVHDTADLTFRAVNEDWTTSTIRVSKVTKKQRTAASPNTTTADALGLDSWTGISQGCGRIVQQLHVTKALLFQPHGSQIGVPIGSIIDLTGRLNAVTLPTSKFALRSNNEVTKEERDELWLNVTLIHAAAIDLLKHAVVTYDMLNTPIYRSMTAQIWDVFEAEQHSTVVRTAVYEFLAIMLPTNMYTLRKSEYSNWSKLIQACCKDLSVEDMTSATAATLQNTSLSQTSKIVATQQTDKVIQPSTLRSTAFQLLPQILQCGEMQMLPNYKSLRAHLDQNAIMLNHEEAILSSVLHPFRGKHSPSLLPFLTRLKARSRSNGGLFELASEALLRPRFPVVQESAEAVLANGHGKIDEINEDEAMADLGHNVDAEQREESPMIDEPIQDDSELSTVNQENTAPLKRDFTTLLEQSADAQLARSDTSNLDASLTASGDMVVDETHTANKRTRLSPDDERSFGEARPREQRSMYQLNIKHDATPVDPASTSYPSSFGQTNYDSSTERKGKETATYDSDSDDSAIPAINATLAGSTDDEDEDDEA